MIRRRRNLLLYSKKFKNNYSFLFDGVNEYIDVESVSSFSFIQNTGIFTLSTWVKFNNYTVVPEYIMGSTSTGVEKGFYFGTETSGTLNFILINGGGTIISSSASNLISNNNYNHIVVVGNGTNIIFYVNGVSTTGSGTMGVFSSGNSTRTINIGRINNFGSGIFNTNLTAAQITEIYNNGKPKDLKKHSAVNNLVSYYRMGDKETWDGTNWTLVDQKGTNNGTSVNMENLDRILDTP